MLLDRDGLLVALRALDHELGVVGVRGEVFVVGGAAMALAYDARRTTVDVDAIFLPAVEVRDAAARVAERLELEPDWLNDGAKAFMPGSDPERIGVFEGDHLSVAAASPRYLLAMKFLAGLDLVESTYPSLEIAPRVQFLLEEMFPAHERQIASQPIVRRDGPDLGR